MTVAKRLDGVGLRTPDFRLPQVAAGVLTDGRNMSDCSVVHGPASMRAKMQRVRDTLSISTLWLLSSARFTVPMTVPSRLGRNLGHLKPGIPICFAIVLLGAVGCQPQGAAPLAPPAQTEIGGDLRRTSFSSSPVLQRLADNGAWINNSVGSKWNGAGTRVEFRQQDITADTLSPVPEIAGSVFVSFSDCRFAPGAMKPLDRMGGLNSLTISESNADRALAAEVTALPGLERLVAGSPGVTTRGLRFLKNAKRLLILSLDGAEMDDGALSLAANCDHLNGCRPRGARNQAAFPGCFEVIAA